jgi:hypothetical protein
MTNTAAESILVQGGGGGKHIIKGAATKNRLQNIIA